MFFLILTWTEDGDGGDAAWRVLRQAYATRPQAEAAAQKHTNEFYGCTIYHLSIEHQTVTELP